VRIRVLGKSPSWQDADGACSGYLAQDAGTCLLLDCGCGVFSKLRKYGDYLAVDGVVISHLHADHFLDLVPYAYALRFGPRQQSPAVPGAGGRERPARPRLIAPRGARSTFRRVVGAWGDEELIEKSFELSEYEPAEAPALNTIRIRFHEVPHFTTTCAVELTSAHGDGRFTFGADSGPTEELVRFARGTDLLILEATLAAPEDEGPRGHLTPAEAGAHARAAGARRLVLTHITDELDASWARGEAERAFGGPVEIAREGAVYDV
jgi:ribonuclease BN (tRNA processing enzyme)